MLGRLPLIVALTITLIFWGSSLVLGYSHGYRAEN